MAGAADIRVGTAGWSIPRASASRFEWAETHLQRYSRWLRCAEINSSFYRPHTAATYATWRASTPPDFRFAVKIPRTITHELKLANALSRVVRGASAVASQAATFSSGLSSQLVLANGLLGFVSRRPDGRLFSVTGCTIAGGKVIEIDVLADPERLSRLDLSAIED